MRRTRVPSVVAAATLAALSVLAPAVARAGGPSVLMAAAIATAPCEPDGVTAADSTIADRVRPFMNGRRLGGSLNGYNVSCARAIVGNVKARGLDQRAAVISVTAAIAESTLHNYTVAVDHDSLGLFQQRPSQGWGLPGQVVDPRYATDSFLNAMIRKDPDGGWLIGDIAQICQRVQASAYPEAYAPEVHDADLVVAALWPGATPVVTPAKPKATPAKKPTGPFQNTLMAAGTGLGALDARYDVSMTDWNSDRRADLVVVQKSGTASGRTDLYVLDGGAALPGVASSFQRLLLNTATALGPTDDRYAFSVADWNNDGHLDLVVVQKSGTASGRTELSVLDGASSFQRYLLQAPTVLGPTDGRYAFSVADWNGDGHLDLVAVQKSGTPSGHTEVQVLDGALNFQSHLLQTATAMGATDGRYDLSFADWNGDGRPDLVAVQKSGTASGRTEVRVLDGASDFGRYLQRSATVLGPTDERDAFSVVDWNGDGRLDLVAVQESGTASGRTEARILAG